MPRNKLSMLMKAGVDPRGRPADRAGYHMDQPPERLEDPATTPRSCLGQRDASPVVGESACSDGRCLRGRSVRGPARGPFAQAFPKQHGSCSSVRAACTRSGVRKIPRRRASLSRRPGRVRFKSKSEVRDPSRHLFRSGTRQVSLATHKTVTHVVATGREGHCTTLDSGGNASAR